MSPLARQGNPTCETVSRYAIRAVADEYQYPYHGKSVGYDRQAAMDDVLNHFPALTTSDEHWVREAVASAEEGLGITA